jgi:hypothetical protein
MKNPFVTQEQAFHFLKCLASFLPFFFFDTRQVYCGYQLGVKGGKRKFNKNPLIFIAPS